MAVTSGSKKSSAQSGAPAQFKQSSRKGKKAWRKHIDLTQVENTIEERRGEERVLGTAVQDQTNSQLFSVDLEGDDHVRKRLPKLSFSDLTSTKVLASRSAIPAVFSRPSSKVNKKVSSSLSKEDKIRMLRIGKRAVKGPFNSYADSSEVGAGSAAFAPSEAVKKSGKYDVWADRGDVMPPAVANEFTVDALLKKKPKLLTSHPRATIAVTAIEAPHDGTSYNPSSVAHQTLLSDAHRIAEQKEVESSKYISIKERMEAARRVVVPGLEEGVEGMKVDEPQALPEDETLIQEDVVVRPAKVPERKTIQQRRKAAKVLADQRLRVELAKRKLRMAAVHNVKSLKKQYEAASSQKEKERAEKQLKKAQAQLQSGLIGRRIGKHKVQAPELDLQLGDELSDSLRAMKPEGNLFRDRLLSMQRRAILEPRTRILPHRRKLKVKEYEKHPWKRFT